MGKSSDIMLTPKGNWSGARIKYTLRIVSHTTPENLLQKAHKYIKTKNKPMSENQWKQLIDAKGKTGDEYFKYLVRNNIMQPEGTKNNEKRYYDIYSLNEDNLAEEIKESEVGEEFLDASKFVVNQVIEGRKVSWDL
jgi:hypothetical protein